MRRDEIVSGAAAPDLLTCASMANLHVYGRREEVPQTKQRQGCLGKTQ